MGNIVHRICFLFLALVTYSNALLFRSRQFLSTSTVCKMNAGFFKDEDQQGPLAEDTFGMSPGVLPTASSRVNFASRTVEVKHNVWVVGSGTLGEIVLSDLLKVGTKNIVAETKSMRRAEAILSLGIDHRLREQRSVEDDASARTVIICIPPSASANYTEEIHDATRLWAGPEAGGNLIYTSSIAVYGESLGNTVTEAFRVDTRSASATKLLAAEEAVLARGGNVMRLAGLYTERRGPHSYWLNKAREGAGTELGVIQGSADGQLNMLHYEDAASAVVALAQSNGFRSKIFLACDNELITKKEICLSALASGLFAGCPLPQFSESGGPVGKRCDSTLTRSLLNWQPKHTSFRVYMRRLGGESLPDVHIAESTVATANQNSGPAAAARENSGDFITSEAKSSLWLPGQDVDF